MGVMRRPPRRKPKARKAKARAIPTARPRVASRKSVVRRASARRGGRSPDGGSPPWPTEGDRQLADPVEAAQEDLRALPEQLIFDRDRRDDDLAEMLGEEYVRSVTSGEEQGVELRDEVVPEEEGGPFVERSANKEFGRDPDDSEPEPLPTAHRAKTRNLR